MKNKTFKIGDIVSINGIGKHKIFGFEWHGKGACACCSGKKYRMAYFNGGYVRHLVNEDQLQKYIGN